MATDLELAVVTLLIKKERYDRFYAYYDGHQPLVYSTERLREIFSNLDARFTQNWSAVVVDSVHERIQLQRITVAGNDVATKRLDELMSASELTLESDDAHLAAIVTGEAYVIVWKDEAKEGETSEPEAYFNDPRNVHLFYDAAKPRVKRFACKWWLGDDGYRYLTLYYPDRLEYYRSDKQIGTGGDAFVSAETYPKSFEQYDGGGGWNVTNPYEEIPVFHFRRERRKIISELQNITEPQDAVNKLLADMMIAAEFGAFPQRYIIGRGGISKLKNSPSEIWDVPANEEDGGQPTSVGQFEPTRLENYLQAIDRWATAIAIISRTPKHYFHTQGGDPSGEALIAMEAPLNKKAQKYIDRFTAPWSELARFMLKLDGTDVADNAIIPHFDRPETVQPYTQALIRKENTQAGIPLVWQLRQEGYTDEEIAQLQADQAEVQKQERETLAATMVERQRQFDQGNTDGDE